MRTLRIALPPVTVVLGWLCASAAPAIAQDGDIIYRGGFDPRPKAHMQREWEFYSQQRGTGTVQDDGQGQDTCALGECESINADSNAGAFTAIFSNETGKTYWASAALQAGFPSDRSVVGAEYRQAMYFRRTDDVAEITMKIRSAELFLADGSGLSDEQCPPSRHDAEPSDPDWCGEFLGALTTFDITTRPDMFVDRSHDIEIQRTAAVAHLWGSSEQGWHFRASKLLGADEAPWAAFSWDPEETANTAEYVLPPPHSVTVPIDHIGVGETVLLQIELRVVAINKLAESTASAYFRDPLDLGDIEIETLGFEPAEGYVDYFPGYKALPEAECDGPTDPSAGQISLAGPALYYPESPGNNALVEVTRSGGSRGDVSVRLQTVAGSAEFGEDFQRIDTVVKFADGEAGSQVGEIALVHDDVAEPDEAFTVRLTDPRGCASLGPQSSMTINILDDDTVPDGPLTYSVGGNVGGLMGLGLELGQGFFDRLTIAADGPFTFAGELEDGSEYGVDIKVQPAHPAQHCSVDRGSGEIDANDVVDVDVTCETPVISPSLDSEFGVDGRPTDTLGSPVGVDFQSDGKIVVAGGAAVRRYQQTGVLDTTFGDGGETRPDPFFPESYDAMIVVPDDKTVVVGERSRDFVVRRLNADGSVDSTFGLDGLMTIDFAGGVDRADDIARQSDGKLVIVGLAQQSGENDFGIARLLSDGSLDTTFDGDGIKAIDISGAGDIASAVALQSDGKIVLSGRTAETGTEEPDIGLVRLNADGTLDSAFGTGGIVRDLTPDLWDQPYDLVIQPDGKLVVAGLRYGIDMTVEVARYNSDGTPDTSFGTAGRVSDFRFGPDEAALALAIQNDGKLVLGGYKTTGGLHRDFAVGRLVSSGAPDQTFGVGGQVTVDFFGGDDGVTALAIDSLGRIVAAGYAENVFRPRLGLVRIAP